MASSRFEQYARIAAIAMLVVGCFLVLQPFLGAILFAGILCFSTWPIFVALRDRLGGRAWLASVVIVMVLVIAMAVPVALAAQSIIVHSSATVELFKGFLDRKSSFELPQFVRDLPVLGPWLETYVRALMEGSAELADLAKRFTEPAKGFLLAMGRAIGEGGQEAEAVAVAALQRAVGLLDHRVHRADPRGCRIDFVEQRHDVDLVRQGEIAAACVGRLPQEGDQRLERRAVGLDGQAAIVGVDAVLLQPEAVQRRRA